LSNEHEKLIKKNRSIEACVQVSKVPTITTVLSAVVILNFKQVNENQLRKDPFIH